MKIELKNISVSYEKGHPILKDISLKFNEGGIYGILGPNGSGKTTLLKAISGILPYEGKIMFDDKDLSSLSRKNIARRIALMPQFSSIYFTYTVKDTVLLGRYAHRGNSFRDILSDSSSDDKKIVNEVLEMTGLSDIANSLLSELSGGQMQRVLLARTIAQETPVILLDEPTNHLDLRFHQELMNYLKDWASKSTTVDNVTHKNTVIAVFHDIGTAASVSDNIVLLNDGKVTKEGPADKILVRDNLKDIYGIDVFDYYEGIHKRLSELDKG